MTTPVAGGLAQELAATVDELRRMTVQVRTGGAASGAGVLWSAGGSENGGLIITNAHVVRGNQATIELSDGTAVRARVVAHDRKRDLAALEFEPYSAMVAAVVRGSPLLRVGELVIAIGHPGGLVGAATLGIIHAVESEGEGRTPRWIRADMRLAPGFSGGPLADTTGRLVGVNTMMQGGLALAVPAAAVEAWVRRAHALAAP
ncbi:MAG: serine protease [Gemmatimonadetes bacterium]|nr:MAG: serine protease [Gemmatimonadota bacterium]